MIPRENLGVLSPANNDYDNEKILNLDALGNIIFKSDFERNFFQLFCCISTIQRSWYQVNRSDPSPSVKISGSNTINFRTLLKKRVRLTSRKSLFVYCLRSPDEGVCHVEGLTSRPEAEVVSLAENVLFVDSRRMKHQGKCYKNFFFIIDTTYSRLFVHGQP